MKRIASIACEPNRYDVLKRAVSSLYNQTDHIYLYLNEFVSYPDWLGDYDKGKITAITGNNEYWNFTDNGKFYALSLIKEDCFYFSCDSDLIYPSDYCQKTIEWIYKFGEIISYHGRIFKEPIRSYYRGHTVFDFRGVNDRAMVLDVGGTGVMCFNTQYFKPDQIYKSEYKCMSDLVFSLEAKKQGRKIICPPHPQNWIVQQEVNGGIQNMFNAKNEGQQIELAKQIYESK